MTSRPVKSIIKLRETMSYQVYRNTTLGTTLQDSLDELLANQQISRSLKDKVLEEVYVPCIFMVFMSL